MFQNSNNFGCIITIKMKFSPCNDGINNGQLYAKCHDYGMKI